MAQTLRAKYLRRFNMIEASQEKTFAFLEDFRKVLMEGRSDPELVRYIERTLSVIATVNLMTEVIEQRFRRGEWPKNNPASPAYRDDMDGD